MAAGNPNPVLVAKLGGLQEVNAAKKHQEEITAAKKNLSTLRQEIQTLEQRIKDLTGQHQSLQRKLIEQTCNVDHENIKVKVLTEKEAENEKRVTALAAEKDELKSKLDTLNKEDMRLVLDFVTKWNTTPEGRLHREQLTNQQISDMKTQIAMIESSISAYEAKKQAYFEACSDLKQLKEQKISEMEQKVINKSLRSEWYKEEEALAKQRLVKEAALQEKNHVVGLQNRIGEVQASIATLKAMVADASKKSLPKPASVASGNRQGKGSAPAQSMDEQAVFKKPTLPASTTASGNRQGKGLVPARSLDEQAVFKKPTAPAASGFKVQPPTQEQNVAQKTLPPPVTEADRSAPKSTPKFSFKKKPKLSSCDTDLGSKM